MSLLYSIQVQTSNLLQFPSITNPEIFHDDHFLFLSRASKVSCTLRYNVRDIIEIPAGLPGVDREKLGNN